MPKPRAKRAIPPPTQTSIVDRHGNELSLTAGGPFITDLARFAEGVLSEKSVRHKYPLPESEWDRLGSDDTLVELVEAEKLRRALNGVATRERARQLVTKGPDVASAVMVDERASPKHRLDAVKVLDDLAANKQAEIPTTVDMSQRFAITINLGADTLRFDASTNSSPVDKMKVIAGDNTTPRRTIDDDDDGQLSTPWGMIAASKRTEGGGGGQHL